MLRTGQIDWGASVDAALVVRGGQIVMSSSLTDGLELSGGDTASAPPAGNWLRALDDPLDGRALQFTVGGGRSSAFMIRRAICAGGLSAV